MIVVIRQMVTNQLGKQALFQSLRHRSFRGLRRASPLIPWAAAKASPVISPAQNEPKLAQFRAEVTKVLRGLFYQKATLLN
jgi:hypothetical protein